MQRAGLVVAPALLLFALTFGALDARAAVTPVVGPQMVGMPDLTVAGQKQPSYSIVTPCSAGESAITFWLKVSNVGAAGSSAINDSHAVLVQDAANAGWSAGATLPAIPAGSSLPVPVTLLGLKNPADMQGHHVFNVIVNGKKSVAERSYANNSMTIAVDFPPAFCTPPVSVAGSSVAHAPTYGTGSQSQVEHRLVSGLPAPTNLTNTITQGVCAAHGGSAGSLACYIGLPAGKLVLIWDYPFPDKIDGFRIYATAPAPLDPRVVQHMLANAPAATQPDPTVKLIVLDPPLQGTCFAVTAFQGANESARSATAFCVGQTNIPKTISLAPDQAGAMVVDFFVWADKSVQDNMYANKGGFVRDLLSFIVGYSHSPSLFRDQAHTNVSQYTNTGFRGYLHFDTSSLAGKHISKARLNLRGAQGGSGGGQTCIATWGGADHRWRPGDRLGFKTINGGGGASPSLLQGPDLSLDVTSTVQSWADSPGSNTGFAVDGDVEIDVEYPMNILSSSCTSTFSTISLDVTYL